MITNVACWRPESHNSGLAGAAAGPETSPYPDSGPRVGDGTIGFGCPQLKAVGRMTFQQS